jgi:hypothetical protein
MLNFTGEIIHGVGRIHSVKDFYLRVEMWRKQSYNNI